MRCKKCGYSSRDVVKTCPECGSDEVENDLLNSIKCPKCGHENLNGVSICDNCEYPLNEIKNMEVSVKKSILTFVAFSVIYTFIPIIFLFYIKVEGFLSIIFSLIFLFGIEPLTCFTVKKVLKSTKYLKTELFVLSLLFIILWIIFCFVAPVNSTFEQRELNFFLIFILFVRIVVWFITRKIFIRD